MDATTVYGELEISLHRVQPGSFQVELRLNDPDSEADMPPEKGEAVIVIDHLRDLQLSPEEYGATLTRSLFRDPHILDFYSKCQTAIEANGRYLRLRLTIGASAPELHALRWELLVNPKTNAPIAFSEHILFSRFLRTEDWRPVKVLPKAELKALIAVSAPADAEAYGLASVDAVGEAGRAQQALGRIRSRVLGVAEPLTIRELMDGLRDGIDILYLVCHGIFPKDLEPAILLQNADGKTARVRASELAQRCSELTRLPRLIVLASCESAGSEVVSDQALSSLAILLSDAGVPAIMAMQSKISMDTVKLMMPVFFHELLRDGQIDRAMAVARGSVRDRRDFWVPALFSRLRGGRIWYIPGFAGEKEQFEQWKSICRFVRSGEFVPVIGPDFGEHVYGTARSLSTELAEKHAFPLATYERSDVAKVTQYIATKTSPKSVRGLVRDVMFKRLVQNARALSITVDKDTKPAELLEEVTAHQLKDDQEPFRILTRLGAKVFVTANSDPLLELALRQAGKEPVELVSRWRDERRGNTSSTFLGEPDPSRPLVFYVYGKSKYDETWVLTEDDFFDYLIRTSRYDLMPVAVSNALTGGSLLFLGFPLDDWKFRILFRIILSKGGSVSLQDYNHVGVQVNPEEHTFADAVRAKKYLERYFSKASIDIYWGTSADFLRELQTQLAKFRDEEPEVQIAGAADAW